MKMEVTGVETIELSDPRGLCNPPAGVGSPIKVGPPWPGVFNPPPMLPTPFTVNPDIPANIPRPIFHKSTPPLRPYVKTSVDGEEDWRKGLPEKWQKGWQSKMGPTTLQMSPADTLEAFAHGYTAITQ